MRILLVYPKFHKFLETNKELIKILNFPITANYKAPPSLGLPIIAAMTDKNEHELFLADENIESIPYDEHFDLVAINCYTPQAVYAYTIADEFKKRNIKTIIGGIHPSCIPEEAVSHADSVAIGEVEVFWDEILEDVKGNSLRKQYKSNRFFNLKKYNQPDRSIYKDKEGYDWDVAFIQTLRGCNYNCFACSQPTAHGRVIRFRNIDSIIEEIDSVKDKQIFFADDVLILPNKRIKDHSMNLFGAIKGMDNDIIVNTSLLLDSDPVLLKKIKEAGVKQLYVVTGFDPISIKAISFGDKQVAYEKIKSVKDAGLDICLSVMVGSDDDNKDIFNNILDFLDFYDIDLAEFYIITPFPGTHFYNKIISEDRLLHRNYTLYNSAHTVFKPKNLTVEELDQGYLYLWEQFFKKKDLSPSTASKYFKTTKHFKEKHNI